MLKVATKIGASTSAAVFLEEPESLPMNDGVVELLVESTALHGFKLQSKVGSPLYVRLFYFDATDFSIGDMFGHEVVNGEGAANIAPRGHLLIGGGADGGTPLRLKVSSSNNLELGYIKLFWSTEQLELEDIAQKSAFELRHGTFRGFDPIDKNIDAYGKWGAEFLAVILQRERSN
ncbi:unnamed protein product [Rhizoctonia solani]|uniref:Jacalin-type lectin domain-containing protein n=1 Tax=Rhizoctonia solani TaxID=456999 RepID=A0A8H3B3W7_9AGAM|nr:unnamed protein product [Rhizoctonia solani]